MTIDQSIALLRASLPRLNGRSLALAQSLLDQFDRRAWLSDKQIAFADVLARRGAGGAQNGCCAQCRARGVNWDAPRDNGTCYECGAPLNGARIKTAIGSLAPMMALFDRAKAKLKYPSLVIGDGAGASYRLKIAGDKARVPGSVNVTSESGSDWYGRILASGEFEASPRVAQPPMLVHALAAFAADPALAAFAHAKATGRCAFCSLPIGEGDDPRARAVGYGEVCAKHWGLPFPSKGTAQRANLSLLSGSAP